MTCIAGINTGSKIIIAGDNMGSNGFTYGQYGSKVFKKDGFIFGVSGDYRVMRLLKHKLKIPKRYVGQDIDDYIYNDFTDSVINLLINNNAAIKKDDKSQMEASFLFGYENKLMQMQGNFQILENAKGYDECGSGGFHAISSLYSTEGLNITPQDRLKKAIECANEFVMSVDNKIDMVELEYKEYKIDCIESPNLPR